MTRILCGQKTKRTRLFRACWWIVNRPVIYLWRLVLCIYRQKKRKTGDAEGPQLLAGECVSGQENATEDGWKAEVVSVTELERAITAASEAMEKARNVADEKAKIEVRLQRAEEQVCVQYC